MILALFYLAVASGVTVNLHYCMGDLASVDYGHEEEGGDCGKCGMPDDNNACCHTDSKLLKLNDDHQLSALAFKWSQPEAVQLDHPAYPAYTFDISSQLFTGSVHSPPDRPFHNIYLYNCVFRI